MRSLEERIKQSKFKNEKHKVIVSILYTNNLLTAHYEEAFGKYGVTIQQYNVLRILRGQHPNPCTINTIRERMLDKMSDASRIVERLRKAGLVDRVPSKKDRRAVDVVITKKGLDVLTQIDKVELHLQEPLKGLSDSEAKQLNDLLEKIMRGFD
jgi:DNA-binding MarR family transcriptional regulator